MYYEMALYKRTHDDTNDPCIKRWQSDIPMSVEPLVILFELDDTSVLQYTDILSGDDFWLICYKKSYTQ